MLPAHIIRTVRSSRAGWSGFVSSGRSGLVTRRRESGDAQRSIESARSFGRPVVATEALGRPNHGELHEILPLFNENRFGWYLWELMIGSDQTRYQWPTSPPVADEIVFQGLLYTYGTSYCEEETELIRAQLRNARAHVRPRNLAGSHSGDLERLSRGLSEAVPPAGIEPAHAV